MSTLDAYTRSDIGLPLGNRTVHFVADGVPLSIASVFDQGEAVGSTVYFWDEQTRQWMWCHQTWETFRIPASDLRRIAEHVCKADREQDAPPA